SSWSIRRSTAHAVRSRSSAPDCTGSLRCGASSGDPPKRAHLPAAPRRSSAKSPGSIGTRRSCTLPPPGGGPTTVARVAFGFSAPMYSIDEPPITRCSPPEREAAQQHALRVELAAARPLEGLLVDADLDAREEVVGVAGPGLDHPQPPPHQHRGDRRPGRPLPSRILVPHHLLVRRPGLLDAAVGPTAALDSIDEARGIREHERLALAHEAPGEVLGLAVEERAVVLAQVRAEEAVGAVGGRDLPHPAQCRDVGPRAVALLGILEPPDERRRAVQIRGAEHEGELLGGEAEPVLLGGP